jgi:AcrR family transcriptional regulator
MQYIMGQVGIVVTVKEGVRVGEEVARILEDLDERDISILRVARDEFAQHGYHAANMERIAAEAGLGKGTIYRRFSNKQILFLVAIGIGRTELTELLSKIAPDLPFKERLLARLNAIAEYFTSHVNIMRLMMHEQSKILEDLDAEDFQKLASPLREAQFRFWKKLLAEAIEEGWLDKGTEEEMSMRASMLSGMFRGCYSELFFFCDTTCPDKSVIDRWTHLLMDFLFEGIFKQVKGE